MNSDRDEFRSVPIQILLSDYMRPVQKLFSDRDDIQTGTTSRPGQLWTGTTCSCKNIQTGLSFYAHGALRQRSGMHKSFAVLSKWRKASRKSITHAVVETNIQTHLLQLTNVYDGLARCEMVSGQCATC